MHWTTCAPLHRQFPLPFPNSCLWDTGKVGRRVGKIGEKKKKTTKKTHYLLLNTEPSSFQPLQCIRLYAVLQILSMWKNKEIQSKRFKRDLDKSKWEGGGRAIVMLLRILLQEEKWSFSSSLRKDRQVILQSFCIVLCKSVMKTRLLLIPPLRKQFSEMRNCLKMSLLKSFAVLFNLRRYCHHHLVLPTLKGGQSKWIWAFLAWRREKIQVWNWTRRITLRHFNAGKQHICSSLLALYHLRGVCSRAAAALRLKTHRLDPGGAGETCLSFDKTSQSVDRLKSLLQTRIGACSCPDKLRPSEMQEHVSPPGRAARLNTTAGLHIWG